MSQLPGVQGNTGYPIDIHGNRLESLRPSERFINKFAGEVLPDLMQKIKDKLKSFRKPPEPPKSSSLRTAMTTKGNQPSPLNFDALRAAQGITDAISTAGVFAKNAGQVGIALPVLDIKNRAVADGTMNSPEARAAELIRMRMELEAARVAQLEKAKRRPGVDQVTPPQIVPDDPIAPPVEPPAPIDYMGALGARMRKGPAKAMQTSYDDGSVAPFAYTPETSPSMDDLKARYRTAFLNTDVGSMQAMRNAEKVLGIDYAGGKYYLDSGRVDANGNPIPMDIDDKERRQLKNFEITPTALQIQRNSGQLLDNPEIYDETVGSNATKMPEYPTDTGEEFDFADVVAALEDIGAPYQSNFSDIGKIRFNY